MQAEQNRLEDQIVGCIVGGAIGDGMGGPVEGLREVTEAQLIGPWRLSDDTTLTLATCEAVREAGLAAEPVAAAFLRWYKAGRFEGLGASTLKAIRDLEAGAHWALSGRKGEMGAGNGAAMRVAPLAFLVDLDDLGDRRVFRDICRITHHNDEAYAGALAVVSAVKLAVRHPGHRLSLEDVADEVPDTRVKDRIRELRSLPSQTPVRDVAEEFGSSGYVVESVPLALFAATRLDPDGFATVLRELVLAGGDTDTNAAIFGQIAGARLGFEALPTKLVEQVPELDWIEREARLFAQRALASGNRLT